MGRKIPTGIRVIIAFFLLSMVLWVVGQGGALVAYDRAAALGFHEPRAGVDPVVVEVTRGIAFADVVIQLPCFLVAIIGLWRLRFYGAVASWFAFAINLYWTTVAWAKQAFYLQSGVKTQPIDPSLHATLAFIFLFSVWASWYLFRNRALFD